MRWLLAVGVLALLGPGCVTPLDALVPGATTSGGATSVHDRTGLRAVSV